MLTDNGIWIQHYGTPKAAWGKMVYEGRVNYLALNRAARRLLMSKKFQTRMKEKGLVINLEEMAIA